MTTKVSSTYLFHILGGYSAELMPLSQNPPYRGWPQWTDWRFHSWSMQLFIEPALQLEIDGLQTKLTCEDEYIGESGRTFAERFREHMRAPSPHT